VSPPTAPIRIGTRGSALALWQAREVARRLAAAGAASEIVVIRTTGDRLGEAPLAEAGGKRLFVKEIEDALLAGTIDVAVHSTKDLPVVLPDGLVMGAFLPRATPFDAIVLPARRAAVAKTLAAVSAVLGATPRIGTSSIRRITQLHRLLPGATFEAIRGNVDTRLKKLDLAPADGGLYDAIVLACAGLERVGFGDRISLALPITACVPAPGQGAVGVERRLDAPAGLAAVVASLDDAATRAEVAAERIVVEILEGGCQAPIGALARAQADGTLELHAAVTSLDGDELRALAFGTMGDPLALGRKVGAQLLADGAAELLARSAVEPRSQTERGET
jgi:hydroxymethylbilane synthase